MGFDIGGAIVGAAKGFAVGGPGTALVGAGVGGVAGDILGRTGGSGISGVSTDVKLSKEGEDLKNKLFETIRTQKFPSKLSSQLIGNALKIEQGKRRSREKALTTTSRSPDVVQSNIGQVIGTGIGGVAEAGAGERAVFGGKRQFERDRFGNLQNIINIERQVPAFVQQAQFTNQLLEQQREAERGASLGLGVQVAGSILSKVDFSNIFAPSTAGTPSTIPSNFSSPRGLIGLPPLNF